MRRRTRISLSTLTIALCLVASISGVPGSGAVPSAAAQGDGASPAARAASPRSSGGEPDAFTLKQRAISAVQENLQRELSDVERCLRRASINLLDNTGRVNRAKQIDLINCGRRLERIQRDLAQLARKSERLAFEATAAQALFQQLLRQTEQRARLQSGSAQ